MEDQAFLKNRIPLRTRKSVRARHLRLQVDSEGKFTLVIPRFTGRQTIDVFLKNNQKWIEKQWKKIKEQEELHPKPKYQNGDTFYYFGEALTLEVKPSDRKRPTIKIRGDKMFITLYRTISREEGERAVKKTIEKFYRKKAEEIIHDRLRHFNKYYGFRYRRVTLRKQKSRWGSCSAAKNLNFNWRLIMAPIGVIDYVVVHELCHLKEMNHSRRFWALVEEIIPRHPKAKKWLRDFHYLLRI